MRCPLAYHVDAGTRARNHVYMKNDSLVWGVFNLLQGKKNYGDSESGTSTTWVYYLVESFEKRFTVLSFEKDFVISSS